MSILFLGGMAALAFLFTRLFGGGDQVAILVWLSACGLALILPLVGILFASTAFRRYATPLTDVMAAADAVAAGDLSARVSETGPGEFGQLARSFNHMAEELEQENQRRRNLTADVAHELRTPLQIIQGNLEGILDGIYEPTDEHVGATLEETRALARLVQDLRTLSLAESGELPMAWQDVEVGELLEDVRTSFVGQAEAAGVDIEVVTHPGTSDSIDSLRIMADEGRLNQALSNLLSNALRHTPAGGKIILEAMATPAAVSIRITDTGEGILPENLPYIFDRFWRADPSRSHSSGAGSGLGLAITRQLVQAHRGQISVTSRAGEGTTFLIELPADGSIH
ncbi:MAG: ATP-binding protein [Chloroflexota bacterium]|nr:ATP-binding protein [Chloroflexota bacterium]